MNVNKILLFICLSFFFSCKSKKEKIYPIQESITESVYASGITKSKEQYDVFSTVSGVIASIPVKEGDLIKKGGTILIISNTAASLNTENAVLSADYSSIGANQEKLKEAEVNTRLALEKMKSDDLLRQRQQELWKEGIGSKNELEQRQLTYQNSKTAYQAASLRYTQLEKQIRFQDQQSQTNLAIASDKNKDYTIRSNVDGKVYILNMKPGEMVNTLTPVATIGDANEFMLELQVDEYDITRIKPDQEIIVSMDSYKGQTFRARVTSIDPLMNNKSKSFTVKARFEKQPGQLYPNLTCEANIVILQKENAVTIPRSYLLPGDSVLLKNGKKKKVTVGLKDYQKAEILNGVTTSDQLYKPGS